MSRASATTASSPSPSRDTHAPPCRCRDGVRDAPGATRPASGTAAAAANSGSTPSRSRTSSLPAVIASTRVGQLSSTGAIWISSRSPTSFSTIAWWRRANSGLERKRSSDPDTPAERGRGQRQFLGGGLDRAQACDLDEGLDRPEWWQPAHNPLLFRYRYQRLPILQFYRLFSHLQHGRSQRKKTVPFRHPLLKTFTSLSSDAALFLRPCLIAGAEPASYLARLPRK